MNEEKRNKIIAAVTVNAILLVIILFAVMIYQFVVIGTLQAKREKIQTEITQYQNKIDKAEQDLEYYRSQEGVLYWLYYNGYLGK